MRRTVLFALVIMTSACNSNSGNGSGDDDDLTSGQTESPNGEVCSSGDPMIVSATNTLSGNSTPDTSVFDTVLSRQDYGPCFRAVDDRLDEVRTGDTVKVACHSGASEDSCFTDFSVDSVEVPDLVPISCEAVGINAFLDAHQDEIDADDYSRVSIEAKYSGDEVWKVEVDAGSLTAISLPSTLIDLVTCGQKFCPHTDLLAVLYDADDVAHPSTLDCSP